MNAAIKEHLAHHRLHMLGCAIAALLVIAAAVIGIPVLAIVGAAFCGAMMVMMVWMMVGPGRGHGH